MTDDNKTALTHRATATAAAYLDALGCKPIETEVQVRAGWVADLASYWYPTLTEARRLRLTNRAREILGVSASVEDRELIPRVYGSGPLTVLVEVKSQRADFLADQRKWQPGDWPAHICCLAYPTGVVDDNELPAGWYGLKLSKAGNKLLNMRRTFARPHPQHMGLVLDFVAAVGIRRDHRTRYAAMRAWAKASRAVDRKRRISYSASGLLCHLAHWLQGAGPLADFPFSGLLRLLGINSLSKEAGNAIQFFEELKRDG